MVETGNALHMKLYGVEEEGGPYNWSPILAIMSIYDGDDLPLSRPGTAHLFVFVGFKQ